MKNHTKVYLESAGLTTADFIPCEICSAPAVDVHHIRARGMGGSKQKDSPENLIGLCRKCHLVFGDKKQFIEMLIDIVKKRLGIG